MQLDKVRIQIRPRTHLEAMDLALRIVRRHWLGLSIAAAVGVAPILAFNTMMFAPGGPVRFERDPFMDEAAPPALSFYLFELLITIPFATAFVTLYLGQATFSRTISVRKLVRDWFGSLWQMFLFQYFLRGMCLAAVITIPIVFFHMKYLNEIILLERSSGFRTSKRVRAFHRGLFSRTIGVTLMDLLLAVSMIVLLSLAIAYLSDLWRGNTADFLDSLLTGGEWLMTWQAQLATWAVIVFFSIARFVSYLDCRIRREGWDVELLMRAEAHSLRALEAA